MTAMTTPNNNSHAENSNLEKTDLPEVIDDRDDDTENSDQLMEKNIVSDDVVLITVSGSAYELEIDDIRRAPSSKLYKYVFNGKRNDLQFKV